MYYTFSAKRSRVYRNFHALINFLWTNVADILYHRRVYRNFHVILIHLDND